MDRYNTIVVVHPGAIGDAVMGTPVARALRANFPQARIVYLTHSSLIPLLELSGAIDDFIPWNKRTPVLQLVQQLREYKPDLLVDLVASVRTRLVCFLTPGRALTYPKDRNPKTWKHVVDNYLQTLAPLNLPIKPAPFPSLTPPVELVRELQQDEEIGSTKPLIALVPGVGKIRPNRAWPPDSWAQLAQRLLKNYGGKVVLVGGTDDEETCAQVASLIGGRCLNLAGRMSLVQTTALLSIADGVISADTGPAHIATAVGKNVVCMMGPTDPARTGPYQMEPIGISVYNQCKCHAQKKCLINAGNGPGDCMQKISVDDVFTRAEKQLSPSVQRG